MYGRALKLIRQYHRITQSDLAKQIDVSPSYLNEIEREKKEPSLDILKRYSERFEIPISSLLLFAEHSENSSDEKARNFIADKILRMLEWIAEDPNSGKKKNREKIYPT